jgi:peptidyl-prolyl cis-trans isomerase C
MRAHSGQYKIVLVVLLWSTLVFVGCKQKSTSPVIARVGDAVLTLDDLFASIPPEYTEVINREQNINYVKQWIDTELLYQEALRRKIHREREILDRLERVKKDLLSAEMVSRSSVINQNAAINDQTIKEYYDAHRNEFIRDQNVVKYLEIVVDDLAAAQQIRHSVTAENFEEVAAAKSKYPASDQQTTPFINVASIPPGLRTALAAGQAPYLSGPVRTEEGYHVLYLIAREDKGGIASLEEVRDVIINKLSNETQKVEVEKVISELRLKTQQEFNFDLIPGSDRPGEQPNR